MMQVFIDLPYMSEISGIRYPPDIRPEIGIRLSKWPDIRPTGYPAKLLSGPSLIILLTELENDKIKLFQQLEYLSSLTTEHLVNFSKIVNFS